MNKKPILTSFSPCIYVFLVSECFGAMRFQELHRLRGAIPVGTLGQRCMLLPNFLKRLLCKR